MKTSSTSTQRSHRERPGDQEIRNYLDKIASLAIYGRTVADPAEARAVLQAFARPSKVLRRLAEGSE